MELQANLAPLTAHDIVVFALSYDPVSVLAGFAATHDITYPLLADEGSHFIDELGIRNTTVEAGSHAWGIPYPGTYFIGADGRVTDKTFHDTHRIRDAAATTIRAHFALPVTGDGPQDRQETEALVAVAAMDAATFVRGERVGLRVTIQTAPGVHIYGQPLPQGYIPTTLAIHTPGAITADPVQYPAPHPFHTAWLDEELMAYEGTVTLDTALTFTDQQEDTTITAILAVQACTTEECYLPRTLTFTLPMRFRPFPE